MHLRDTLIERIAAGIASAQSRHESLTGWAEAALSVVETATSTCPQCGDVGGWVNAGSSGRVYEALCELCGGQPGPLLILQVLGWTPDGWMHEGASFTGRFPPRQEGQ